MTETLPDAPASETPSPTPTDVGVRPDPPRYAVKVGVPVHTLDEAWRLAQALALADLVPRALRGKPSDILLIILDGAEIGLTPAQALRGIDAVQGRTRISGRLWGAQLRKHGHRYKIVERVPLTSCTVEIERGDTGETLVETYTIEDAVRAGLCKVVDGQVRARSRNNEPLPWETVTDRLLLWRSLANGATILCPEIVFGFDVNDGSEPPPEDAPPERVQATAQREDAPAPVSEESLAEADEKVRAGAEALVRDFGGAVPDDEHDADVVDAEIVEEGEDEPQGDLDPGPGYVDPWTAAERVDDVTGDDT